MKILLVLVIFVSLLLFTVSNVKAETYSVILLPNSVNQGCQTNNSCLSVGNLLINKGDTVTWINNSPSYHTISINGEMSNVLSKMSHSVSFNVPGTYQFSSVQYPWVKGTISVQSAYQVPLSTPLTPSQKNSESFSSKQTETTKQILNEESIHIKLDKKNFSEKDTIKVYGTITQVHSGYSVTIRVKSPDNNLAYADQMPLHGKQFSFEIPIGGNIKKPGMYIVEATYGPKSLSDVTSFYFEGIHEVTTPQLSPNPFTSKNQVVLPTVSLDIVIILAVIAIIITVICVLAVIKNKKKRQPSKKSKETTQTQDDYEPNNFSDALGELARRINRDNGNPSDSNKEQQKPKSESNKQKKEEKQDRRKEKKSNPGKYSSTPDFSSDDPYRILGVKPDMPKSEIKQKYQELTKQYNASRGIINRTKKEQEELTTIQAKINGAWRQINNKT